MNLNPRQKCLLLYLLNNRRVNANFAGNKLARAGLLNYSGRPSNLCLAGSAVLRSLERQELVVRYLSDSTRWSVLLWSLTRKGEKVAESLKREAVEQ